MKYLLLMALFIPGLAQASSCWSPLLKKTVQHGDMGKRKCCYYGKWTNDKTKCYKHSVPKPIFKPIREPIRKPVRPPVRSKYTYKNQYKRVSSLRTGVSNCNDRVVAKQRLQVQCNKKAQEARSFGLTISSSYVKSSINLSVSNQNSVVSGRPCTASASGTCVLTQRIRN